MDATPVRSREHDADRQPAIRLDAVRATHHTGLLYTAKGTSALLVPFANHIQQASGSWWTVFLAAAMMNFVVVVLAMFVLRPLRRAEERAFAAGLALIEA